MMKLKNIYDSSQMHGWCQDLPNGGQAPRQWQHPEAPTKMTGCWKDGEP